MGKIILTADRPSGRLHLGHYIGSLLNRVDLQNQHKQYVMIADVQALTDNFDTPDKIRSSVYELAYDYLAVGIDPKKTTIFIQSQIPEIAELTIYFLNLVNLGRLERNPTVKAEIRQKNFGDVIPVGFLCYPISQSADIATFQAELIPVGEDQIPMIEQANEIVRRFNGIYNTDCLKESKPLLSKTPRLVGIDGQAKASKSLGNAIFLSDEPNVIKEKVFSMFTDPDHIRASDPGKVEGNVVFTYLDAFHPDKGEVEDLKAKYRRGGLGDTVVKGILNDVLQNLLTPIHEKRFSLKRDHIFDVLRTGINEAKLAAARTMVQVRTAMGVNYSDKE
ncbi:MAG: tryptophan--tRNA ligase [Holosporales bacterium]|jgi:tryptophanyl-tRNA synthetase|nr:tryptophan--tRNA ligase [Holosporales bacterium]